MADNVDIEAAVRLARETVDAGHPHYTDDVDVLARAVLALHDLLQLQRFSDEGVSKLMEDTEEEAVTNVQLRAALIEALDIAEGYGLRERDAHRDSIRLIELRKLVTP